MPWTAFDVLVGAVFCILGGLLVPSRSRRSVGVLMASTGAAWLVGSAFPPAIFLYRGPLSQLLICYPHGRPRGRLAQAAVAAGYLETVQPVGNRWISVGAAAVVFGATVVGRQRARGSDRRLRTTSVVICGVVMGILGLGAVARLTGVTVDPGLNVAYEFTLVAAAVVLFADLLWTRSRRPAITSLVIDLGRTKALGPVRDKLRDALADPALQIGFLDPTSGVTVDEAGRPVLLQPAGGGRARTNLQHDGRDVCVVDHAAGVLDDRALRESVTALTALAFANTKLQTEIETRVAQVDGSRRRILDAADAERRALEHDLRLSTEARLNCIESLLDPEDGTLSDLLADSRRALADFARGVHPRALTLGGLAAACRDLARATPIPVILDIPKARLAPELELHLYFVCAEAVANAGKHAGASHVRIALRAAADHVRVTVTDDGAGGAASHSHVRDGGTGLRGLADRLAVIDGTLTIHSPPGRGTTITATVPTAPPTTVPTDDQRAKHRAQVDAAAPA